MATNHHPHADVLWAYAVGNLDEASSVLIATHMALCPACRRDVAAMEAAGGTMFESVETASVSNDAFDRLMARIDADTANDELPKNVERFDVARKSTRADTILPRPLRDYLSGDFEGFAWRKMAAGVEYVDIDVDPQGYRARVLRIAPGTRVPHHGHGGEEMTMVLAGGYTDESGSFARGDVQCADQSTVHQPVADPGEPCIALTVTRGALVPTGFLSVLTRLFPRLGA